MGEETKLSTAYMVDEEGNRKELGKITQIECKEDKENMEYIEQK